MIKTLPYDESDALHGGRRWQDSRGNTLRLHFPGITAQGIQSELRHSGQSRFDFDWKPLWEMDETPLWESLVKAHDEALSEAHRKGYLGGILVTTKSLGDGEYDRTPGVLSFVALNYRKDRNDPWRFGTVISTVHLIR